MSRRAPVPLAVFERCFFIHWGCLYRDGMDVDPEIREMQRREHGPDSTDWIPRLDKPGSRPAVFLHVRSGEYVLAKTGQDAFASSNLGYLLANLGVKSIVLVGGHAGACLGRTARA